MDFSREAAKITMTRKDEVIRLLDRYTPEYFVRAETSEEKIEVKA